MKFILFIPLQIIVGLAMGLYVFIGKILAFIMVPIGILTKWKYTITWPWDAVHNPRTKAYYDPWYDILSHRSHNWFSRWCVKRGGFWKEFYWRVRNGFSNGARFTFSNVDPAYVTRYEFTYAYYEYSSSHPWLARYRYARPFGSPGKGLTFYTGWKFDRSSNPNAEEFGFTFRPPKYENI